MKKPDYEVKKKQILETEIDNLKIQMKQKSQIRDDFDNKSPDYAEEFLVDNSLAPKISLCVNAKQQNTVFSIPNRLKNGAMMCHLDALDLQIRRQRVRCKKQRVPAIFL